MHFQYIQIDNTMSSRDELVNIIIEIERHSNQKWEYDREKDCLFLDRVLPYPYFYPYAYGFFPNTLGNDGDELDVLLITDRPYKNYTEEKTTVAGYIVGGLMMYDEKGRDEKIFVVPEDEFEYYESKSVIEKQTIYANICWFFSEYKSKSADSSKWSRIKHLLDRTTAIQIYKESSLSNLQKM